MEILGSGASADEYSRRYNFLLDTLAPACLDLAISCHRFDLVAVLHALHQTILLRY